MGSVYAAHHPRIGKRVALKVIHPELASNEEMLFRFFQEARAVTQIGHENIVEVQDYGQSPEGESFIVMELLEGRGLGELLKNEGALSVPRAVHIALQLADGLAAARRARHHPPRPQARQHHAHPSRQRQRLRQDSRLRPGQADRAGPDAAAQDAHRIAPRHRALHGAGAGRVEADRSPRRRVRARLHFVSDDGGPRAVPRRGIRRRAHQAHPRASAALDAPQPAGAEGHREDRAARARQEARVPLRDDGGVPHRAARSRAVRHDHGLRKGDAHDPFGPDTGDHVERRGQDAVRRHAGDHHGAGIGAGARSSRTRRRCRAKRRPR